MAKVTTQKSCIQQPQYYGHNLQDQVRKHRGIGLCSTHKYTSFTLALQNVRRFYVPIHLFDTLRKIVIFVTVMKVDFFFFIMSRMYSLHDTMVVGNLHRGCRHRSCWPWSCNPWHPSSYSIVFHFGAKSTSFMLVSKGAWRLYIYIPHWDRGYVKYHIKCSYIRRRV